jgi:hypothetical protein
VNVAADGALVHCPELRLLMREPVERDAPEQVRDIHERAVAYYAAGPARRGPR